MKSIKQLGAEIHQNARSKGFSDKQRNTGEMLMLIVSEIAEAMEADRKSLFADRGQFEHYLANPSVDGKSELSFKDIFGNYIKDSFEDELADAAIRIFDLAESRGIDLQWHIEQKMRYNSMREHMHGKKY